LDRISQPNREKATESNHAVVFYSEVYEIERRVKENEYGETQCYDYRQTHAQPLLADHKKWLDTLSLRARPKGRLGKAVRCSIEHCDPLTAYTAYLEGGRRGVDNNGPELDIKPFVMARKTFLLAATPDGADSLGVDFGWVITSRHHGHEPMRYYEFILKRIPYCKTFDDYEKLLPLNVHIQ
jgi:transposase